MTFPIQRQIVLMIRTTLVTKPLMLIPVMSKRRHRSRTSRRRDDYSSSSSDDDKEDDNDGYAPRRRRGRELKPRGFDGSGSFESFWAHFSNCAEYNRWIDADSLANLRQALTGEAAQLMWDSSPKEVDSLRKLTKPLRSHCCVVAQW